MEFLEARQVLATLVISEINYNPYDQVVEFGHSSPLSADYEFVEIQNVGTEPANLDGVSLVQVPVEEKVEGIVFTFPASLLAPGGRVVVAGNLQAFQTRYGATPNLAGAWTGGPLSNQGETLTLTDGDGNILFQVAYDSNAAWPTRANGVGASLELKDSTLDPNDSTNWRSSVEYGGTPGRAPGDRTTRVIINEVLAHTDPPLKDAVELRNMTNVPLDITGWYLSDRIGRPFNYRLGRHSIIPANGYLVLTADDFSPGGGTLPTDVGLSERGDHLLLISSNSQGRPLNIEDYFVLTPTANAVSVGSALDVRDSSEPLPLAELSFGRANGAHRPSDVVISEVQYHPSDDDSYKEFVELRNASGRPLVLDNWQLDDAVQFSVPVGTTLAPDEAVVVVPFDPKIDLDRTAAFRTFYEVDATVRLLGPWSTNSQNVPDTLSNRAETITLRMPMDDIDVIVYGAVDRVEYSDSAQDSWPTVADGGGGSLSRSANRVFGNLATSWLATRPSPGDRPASYANSPLLTLDTPANEEIGRDDTIIRGAGDVDVYRFRSAAAGEYSISVRPVDLETDTVARLFTTSGHEVAASNMQDAERVATLTTNLPANVDYYLVVSGDSSVADPRAYDPFTGIGLIEGIEGTYGVIIKRSAEVEKPWQNSENSLDVNDDSFVSPIDALTVINQLNGSGTLPTGLASPPPYLDVNGDNTLSPVDALLVINFLNQAPAAVASRASVAAVEEFVTDALFQRADASDLEWAAWLLNTDHDRRLKEHTA